MPASYQSVQSIHVAVDFVFQHPEQAGVWHDISNSLAFLSVKTEEELFNKISQLDAAGIKYTAFREPDVGYAITAIALEPGEQTKEFCRKLPTALKPPCLKGHSELKANALYERLRVLRQTVEDMSHCYQYKQVSVLDHGMAVLSRFKELKKILQGKGSELQWFLPEWIEDYKDLLLGRLLNDFIISFPTHVLVPKEFTNDIAF